MKGVIAGPKNEKCKLKQKEVKDNKTYKYEREYEVKHPIRKVKIVTTSDGIRHNIQHVLAGIDAINYAVSEFTVKTVKFHTNNYDAATWAGDLGTMGAYFRYCLLAKDDYIQELIQLDKEGDTEKSYESKANKWVKEKWQKLANKESSSGDLKEIGEGLRKQTSWTFANTCLNKM